MRIMTSDIIRGRENAPESETQLLNRQFTIPRRPVPQRWEEKDTPLVTEQHITTHNKKVPLREEIIVFQLWKWELGSLLLSFAAFIAIITVLRINENKDISHWKALLSINAIVAILSAIFKLSLALPISNSISQLKWIYFSKSYQKLDHIDVYDQASRGAWGSVLFLGRQIQGSRLSNIASLGAFITLLTLAVDPFSQASVSIGLCNRNLPHSASIPRSMNYSTYVRTGPGTGYPVSSMQFAILTGLFSPAPNSSIAMSNAVQCPTGNCTFGTPESNIAFSSLTMCHSCRDISGSIINDTENGRILLGEKFNSVEVSSITKDDFIPGPIFNMTVATGELQEPFADGEWQRTSMMNIIGLGYSNGRYTNSTSSSGSKYPLIAFECGLRPCVKSFSASVSKGVYMEEELSRQYLHQIHFNGGAPFFETAVDTAVINGTFIKCIPQSQMSETHTVQVLPLEAQVPYSGKPILLADLWLPRQCKHEIELGPLNSMSQYIDSLVSFASILSQPGNQRSGPGWLLRLWNQGNITIDSVNKFMGELASSIGAELRKNGDPVYNTALTAKEEYWTVARGDAQYMEPCIRVRWPFLSFLAALLVLEIIFFTATIIIHYRHHWFLDWKSATLPLLFQNIKGINESEKESTETENEEQQYSTEYYEMAKSTVAKLTMVDGQWEFTSKSEEDKDDL